MKCFWCNKTLYKTTKTKDHLVPYAIERNNDCVPSCGECNVDRGKVVGEYLLLKKTIEIYRKDNKISNYNSNITIPKKLLKKEKELIVHQKKWVAKEKAKAGKVYSDFPFKPLFEKGKKMPYLRFVGDVHGRIGEMSKICTDAKYSICVGDIGFDYRNIKMDAKKHFLLKGNHDSFKGKDPDNFLGDYGILNIPSFEKIFFLRGAHSIDKNLRTIGVDWFEEEELSYGNLEKAIDFYTEHKPDFVVTHCAPGSLLGEIPFRRLGGKGIIRSRTDWALDAMYNIHQPKTWIFGHYHIDWDCVIPRNGVSTRFICLKELSFIDFEKI